MISNKVTPFSGREIADLMRKRGRATNQKSRLPLFCHLLRTFWKCRFVKATRKAGTNFPASLMALGSLLLKGPLLRSYKLPPPLLSGLRPERDSHSSPVSWPAASLLFRALCQAERNLPRRSHRPGSLLFLGLSPGINKLASPVF